MCDTNSQKGRSAAAVSLRQACGNISMQQQSRETSAWHSSVSEHAQCQVARCHCCLSHPWNTITHSSARATVTCRGRCCRHAAPAAASTGATIRHESVAPTTFSLHECHREAAGQSPACSAAIKTAACGRHRTAAPPHPLPRPLAPLIHHRTALGPAPVPQRPCLPLVPLPRQESVENCHRHAVDNPTRPPFSLRCRPCAFPIQPQKAHVPLIQRRRRVTRPGPGRSVRPPRRRRA